MCTVHAETVVARHTHSQTVPDSDGVALQNASMTCTKRGGECCICKIRHFKITGFRKPSTTGKARRACSQYRGAESGFGTQQVASSCTFVRNTSNQPKYTGNTRKHCPKAHLQAYCSSTPADLCCLATRILRNRQPAPCSNRNRLLIKQLRGQCRSGELTS